MVGWLHKRHHYSSAVGCGRADQIAVQTWSMSIYVTYDCKYVSFGIFFRVLYPCASGKTEGFMDTFCKIREKIGLAGLHTVQNRRPCLTCATHHLNPFQSQRYNSILERYRGIPRACGQPHYQLRGVRVPEAETS